MAWWHNSYYASLSDAKWVQSEVESISTFNVDWEKQALSWNRAIRQSSVACNVVYFVSGQQHEACKLHQTLPLTFTLTFNRLWYAYLWGGVSLQACRNACFIVWHLGSLLFSCWFQVLTTNNQSLDIDFASLQRLQFLSLKVCASFPFFPSETKTIK